MAVRRCPAGYPSPGPARPPAQHDWKTDVARLSEQKDQLEEKLTRQSAAFRAARAEIRRTPEQLQAALPSDAALIDVLEYTHLSPPPERKGELKRERRLIAFVVRPDRPIARVELGPLAPIRAAIDDWRPILRREKPAPQDEQGGPAARLRRLVWSPLEEHLAGVATVLVSPDGALGLVPLEALPGKAAGSYLIEDYTIALVPVPRMFGVDGAVAADGPKLARLRPRRRRCCWSATSITAATPAQDPTVREPVGRRGDAGRRAAPVRAAARHRRRGRGHRGRLPAPLPRRPPLMLGQGRATEAALREDAARYRYLHLATHGYFAPPSIRSALGPSDKPARPGTDLFGAGGVAGFHPGLLSGLALAGANVRPTPTGKDDGILTALEVAELDLAKVELAVLSACETGLGEVAGGEGLLGLQRAFQVAGARAVVASLWSIGDEPTRALIAQFYEDLWRNGRPPVEACREAQLSMLRGSLGQKTLKSLREPQVSIPGGNLDRGTLKRKADTAESDRLSPYYWAAFVLSTDRP